MEYLKILRDIDVGVWHLVIVSLTCLALQALKGRFEIRLGNGWFFIKYIGPKAQDVNGTH